MGDNTERMLGEISGKLDQVIDGFREHRDDDIRRFGEVDEQLERHAADINKAKGAKAALIATAAAVSGFVGVAIAAAEKLLK